ncbi:ABC transporter ATP-binding protein [Streptomyces sp. BE308]|uniref:ABC transporter ATP-binding protein n=1 Tax=Streptomyces sp. BE308 TaxID=3002529 RepID=UPI002E76EA32|nr:ABC transporter ATP-binding protein [Streptomyces sp. BE308]MEE1792209.1 ABC transporter ATP-binding protein [Streptomyces sp. BE308]
MVDDVLGQVAMAAGGQREECLYAHDSGVAAERRSPPGTTMSTDDHAGRDERPHGRWLRPRTDGAPRAAGTVRDLAAALPRAGRGLTAGLLAVTLLTGLLPLVQIGLTSIAVGSLPDAVRHGAGTRAHTRLVLVLAVLTAVFFAAQAAVPLQRSLCRALGTRLEERTRMRVMAVADGEEHGGEGLREAVARARDIRTAAFGPSAAVGGLSGLVAGRLHGLAAAAVLATFQWWAPLVLLGTFLPWDRYFRQEHAKVAKGWAGRTEEQERARYYRDLAFDPAAGKEIRIFGLAGFVGDRFARHFRRAMSPVWRGRGTDLRRFLPRVALVALGYAVVYGSMGRELSNGTLGLTATVLYVQTAGQIWRIVPSFNDLSRLAIGARAVSAAARLPEPAGHASQRAVPPAPAHRPVIRFENVTYRYPAAADEVLHGIDLTVPAGGTLAVVGANGAGKSTLINLLCGLVRPTGGRVTSDGTDLVDLAEGEWQAGVAAVFQDYVRFELLAREAIGIGQLADVERESRVRAAAFRADITGVLDGLPHGLDTQLGPRWTGGVGLSGGQWQRLALARASMRTSPLLLVLDEPSAGIDAVTEHAIFERYTRASREGALSGAVTLLVSHRFSTVRMADRIVVLDGGRITESGSHDELMRLGGTYAELFHLQADGYGRSGDRTLSTS